jgi:hypothetical protein
MDHPRNAMTAQADASHDAPDLATMFTDCTFEDAPPASQDPGSPVFRGDICLYYALDGGAFGSQGMRWTGCTFIAHGVRSVLTGNPGTTEYNRCDFTHLRSDRNDGLYAYQAQFEGSRISECRFMESGLTRKFFIKLDNVTVAPTPTNGRPTNVSGPMVLWQSITVPPGRVGNIPPGVYPAP